MSRSDSHIGKLVSYFNIKITVSTVSVSLRQQ